MQENLLDGRVALVTGGSRGLGLGMTHALLAAGCKVAITAFHEPQALKEVEQQVAREKGDNWLISIRADVCSAEQSAAAVLQTFARFGRLDILINNAGSYINTLTPDGQPKAVPFWETTADEWASVMDTNANGPFNMARVAAPLMIKGGYGRIINVSTRWPTMRRSGFGSYGPSKVALEAATAMWATDLKSTGVTCNVLLPGGRAATRLVGSVVAASTKPRLPATVMGPPAVWLSSELSAAWTGRRFIAADWNPDLPMDKAAEGAASPACELPHIV